MNRSARLERIEQILLEHPDGIRVLDLSAACAVDRRTIYRDIQMMQQQGIPIWQNGGRFGIAREQYLTHMRVNMNEAFTLLWALRLLNHQNESHNPHAQGLVKKILEALPPRLARQIEATYSAETPKPRDTKLLRVIEHVTRAWADSLKLLVWYKPTRGSRPLRLVIAPHILDTTPEGKLYVIGQNDQTREVRIYNLSRITRAEVLEDEPFRRSLSVDLRQYVNAAHEISEKPYPDTVVLRFLPEAAAAIKERYHGQKFENAEDGSCIFITKVKDWQEMEKWVGSWGAQVEVIAPAEFRKRVAANIRQAAQLYG